MMWLFKIAGPCREYDYYQGFVLTAEDEDTARYMAADRAISEMYFISKRPQISSSAAEGITEELHWWLYVATAEHLGIATSRPDSRSFVLDDYLRG